MNPGAVEVRQIAVPHAARRLSTLTRLDYCDAFVVDIGPDTDLTGEQWARAMLEGAPVNTRRALRWGWTALGLNLGSTEDHERVLGWEVRRSAPEFALIGADSPLGLRGEVLFKPERRTLLFATLVKLENPLARTIWAGFSPGHRQAVRSLLEQLSAR